MCAYIHAATLGGVWRLFLNKMLEVTSEAIWEHNAKI